MELQRGDVRLFTDCLSVTSAFNIIILSYQKVEQPSWAVTLLVYVEVPLQGPCWETDYSKKTLVRDFQYLQAKIWGTDSK